MLMKNIAATKKRKRTWNFARVSWSSFWKEGKNQLGVMSFSQVSAQQPFP